MSLEVDLRRIVKPDVGPTSSFTTTSQSSSIGQPDDDDDDDLTDDDEQEVQSSLSSLTSLEDSLPIKRKGLSKFYSGKSKSYGNLTQVRNVKELEKSDNPFNKRKRTLMAYNLMFKTNNMINKKKKSGTGFFYSHSNHISMPILPLSQLDDHDHYQDHDDHDDDGGGVVDQEQEQVNFSDTEDYFGQTSSFRLHQIKEHRPYHKSFMDNSNNNNNNNNNNNVNLVACSSSVLVSNERFRHR